MRPSEEATLLGVAAMWATRSTCSRLSVGAVLAVDGRAFAQGYNGAPSGLPHCEHRPDDPSCVRAVHAEANAVANAARHGAPVFGSTLYVTHSPCQGCAGLLVNAGVVAVVYSTPFRSPAGVDLLRAAGLDVRIGALV